MESSGIAIVGIGCRLPGGANSPDEFWRLLINGTDAITDVPPDRWDMRRFFDSDREVPGKIYARQGGFLPDPVDRFDASFFGMAPREAAVLDPQQRLLLEVAWECMEDAGVSPSRLQGSRTGVFIGGFTLDNKITLLSVNGRESIMPNTATSSTMVMLSNRLSYTYDLRGPSVSIDTACSSSLVATHMACRSLLERECDAALAGGVNVMTRPEYSIAMCQGGFLSPTSRCRAFDHRADGYVRGEGGAIVLLKRLKDAVRDGNRIYAVIRATGANQDGRTPGITTPGMESQEALIREVCERAGVASADVHVAEAHGTGTQAGDPVEAAALGSALGDGRGTPLLVSSVKTNIGHLEAAAGVAGLIKLALSLYYRAVPRSLHFEKPNPRIDLEKLSLAIATETMPLPAAGDVFGVVNSFGYGGTNAHALLASPPPVAASTRVKAPQSAGVVNDFRVYPVSAADANALAQRAADLCNSLDSKTDLDCWGSTLAHGRSQLSHRAAILAADAGELRHGLRALAEGRLAPSVLTGRAQSNRGPVFVYTGMGTQWWGMGEELFASSSVFRETIEECDGIWADLGGESLTTWFLRDDARRAMGFGKSGEAIEEPAFAQPANLVLQIALTRAWRALGFEPAAIIGHSVGEIAAAWAAGVLALEQALCLTFHRSRLQQRLAGRGGMLAVGLGEREANRLLQPYQPRVTIGAINSDNSVTLTGEPRLLSEIASECGRRSIFARKLRVAVAYHSPEMDVLEDEFLNAVRDITPKRPETPLYSTVSGARVDSAVHDAAYWWRNTRQPVLLKSALVEVLGHGYDTFVEVGPHPALSGSIEECARAARVSPVVAHTLKRSSPETQELLIEAARLYTSGVNLNWESWFERTALLPLPRYPWQRTRFWAETEIGKFDRVGDPHAPLLLQRKSEGPFPVWESDLNRNFIPWLDDHRVHGLSVFPAAGYIAAALEAARLLDRPSVIRQLRFPLALLTDRACIVRIEVSSDDVLRFHSRRNGEVSWALHATGRLAEKTGGCGGAAPLGMRDAGDLQDLKPSLLYDGLRARGLIYGPCFQTIKSFRTNGKDFEMDFALGDDVSGAGNWMVDPVLLDAAFHAFLATLPDDGPRGAMVPVSIDEVRVFGPVPGNVSAAGRLRTLTAQSLVGDVDVRDASGAVVVQVRGLRCQTVRRSEPENIADWFYEEVWQPSDAPAVVDGRWIVLHAGDHDRLHAQSVWRSLRIAGVDAKLAKFNGAAPEGAWSGIALAVAAAESDVAGIDAGSSLLAMLQCLAQSPVYDPRVVIVTRRAQAFDEGDASPADAALWGLGRVAHNEMMSFLQLRLVDVDGTAASGPLAGAITGETAETEFLIRGFDTSVCRLVRLDLQTQEESAPPDAPAELVATRPGSPDSLVWVETERRAPAPGEIEVEVRAVPLNFKDLIKVMGMLPVSYLERTYSGNSIGLEAAGVVTRVGEGVTRYRVGDAVVLPSPSGCFRTHITGSTRYIAHKPAHQTFEEAGCYINFVTAYYGLSTIARLGPGERVLIHSATGGVGLAAIQVARAAGAEVFATAGSEHKRDYLRKIGVRFVYDSRTVAFADQILADTQGEGVDVVLNSQPGDIMRRSMEVLKPYGRFIEIGKRAIHEDAALLLHDFDRNLSFSAIDIDRMMADNPPLFRRLVDEVHQKFDQRTFEAIPTTVFASAAAADAFHTLARGQHIGKIVVAIDGSHQARRAAGAFRQIRRDGVYLITGGFGGFARILAAWLAEQGARKIVLVSRSGASSEGARAFVRSLEQRGARVWVEKLDIAERESVRALIARIQAEGHNLAGIFHTAMVLDDGVLRDLTSERLAKVMRPKALGAIWLDEATRGLELDAFVLFSSVSAITGNPGQGSYVAANAVLDALAHRRRARGDSALSVNWGVLREVGVVARNREVETHLDRLGIRGFRPPAALECLSRLLHGAPAQAGIFDIDWAKWAESSPDARVPRFSQFVDAGGRGVHPLAAKLAAMTPAEQSDFVEAAVCSQLARVIRTTPDKIDVDLSLENMGVDSLMSVELVTALSDVLSVDLPPMLLMQGRSIRALARQIIGSILPDPPTPEDRIEEMTEEELDALLASAGQTAVEK